MLRLISYLAPSIPADLYRLIAADLEATCGVAATLEFDERVSGPLEGDDEPFSSARADVGFLCAPSYRWMSTSRPHTVELLPLPVPTDPRANGRPVYFAEIVVPTESTARKLTDLRGGVWAYNDRNSRSGWFSMIEKLGESFFSLCIESGSHLKSMELVKRHGAALSHFGLARFAPPDESLYV